MRVLKAYKTWKKTVYKRRAWNIGFVDFNDETIFKPLDISWLHTNYDDGWFADPFILHDAGDHLDVLAEHFVDADNLGHIARLRIRREQGRYRLEDVVPIIRDGTHFSFPNIYRDNERIFIYPENWQSNTLQYYVYDQNDDRADPVECLYSAPLIDAVITEAFGQPRLFATREDRDPCGSELEIFVSPSNDWRGPYIKETDYVFSDRVARGAGQFFTLGERLIRVAQDNNGRYGGGLVFFETHFDGRNFSFTEIARHMPSDANYRLGLHTFNVHGGIAAVDGLGYSHPVRRVTYRMKRWFQFRRPR